MDTQQAQQKVKEQFDKLPPYIQKYIASDELNETMRAIQQEFGLHVDDAGILYDESVFVLLGISTGETFTKKLRDRIDSVDDEKVIEIAKTVNERVFEPLRQKLLKMSAEADSGKREPSTDQGQSSTPPVNISIRSKPSETEQEATVETKGPTPTPPGSEMEQRMKESTHIPRTEEEGGEDKKSEAPSYGGADPYREPIE